MGNYYDQRRMAIKIIEKCLEDGLTDEETYFKVGENTGLTKKFVDQQMDLIFQKVKIEKDREEKKKKEAARVKQEIEKPATEEEVDAILFN